MIIRLKFAIRIVFANPEKVGSAFVLPNKENSISL